MKKKCSEKIIGNGRKDGQEDVRAEKKVIGKKNIWLYRGREYKGEKMEKEKLL